MPLGMEVGLSPGDFMLDGDRLPSPEKRAQSPNFRPMSRGQTTGWTKIALGMEVGLGPGDLCSMGTQLPQNRGHTHHHPVVADVYCGQTAGWIKTPLGTEVDLGQGHIVLDGVPPLRETGTEPPSFLPMSIVATVAHLSYC